MAASTSDAVHGNVTTILARSERSLRSYLEEVWRFRDLLFFLVLRDIRVRYSQTVLGFGWSILQPLLQIIADDLEVSQSAVETPAVWREVLSWAADLLVVAGLLASCHRWFADRRSGRDGNGAVHRRLWALALIPAVLMAGVLLSSFQVYVKNGQVRGLLGAATPS